MLMSFNQMLSILGIFKARGTEMFRNIVGWPASLVGGGITRVLFVKCLFHSALYAPFMITMITPGFACVCALVILLPKTWWERRKLKLAVCLLRRWDR